jgi:hypothetical protein
MAKITVLQKQGISMDSTVNEVLDRLRGVKIPVKALAWRQTPSDRIRHYDVWTKASNLEGNKRFATLNSHSQCRS